MQGQRKNMLINVENAEFLYEDASCLPLIDEQFVTLIARVEILKAALTESKPTLNRIIRMFRISVNAYKERKIKIRLGRGRNLKIRKFCQCDLKNA
uniref:Uncharacterized protein n=1 Tax=Romanomermis culicivorax TaxID=13658 RepID=A0A915KPX0_ROMCU